MIAGELMNATLIREQVWQLIARSCMYLDEENYPDYFSLTDESFEYTITCYSPELRQDMVLLKHNKKGLTDLTANIPNHVRLMGRLFRQAQLYVVSDKDACFHATSYLTVVYTDQDGVSRFFCAGRYLDRVLIDDKGPKLLSRHFRMETRDIGAGCHFPI